VNKEIKVNRLVYLALENKVNGYLTKEKVKSLFDEIYKYKPNEIPELYKAILLNKLIATALEKYTISKNTKIFNVLNKTQLYNYSSIVKSVFTNYVLRNQYVNTIDDISEFVRSLYLTDNEEYSYLNSVNKSDIVSKLTDYENLYNNGFAIKLNTNFKGKYNQFEYISKILSKVDKNIKYYGKGKRIWFTWDLMLYTWDANKTFVNKLHAALDLTITAEEFGTTFFRNGQIAILLAFRLYLGVNNIQFKNIYNQINEYLVSIESSQITLEELCEAVDSLSVLGELGKKLQEQLKGNTYE